MKNKIIDWKLNNNEISKMIIYFNNFISDNKLQKYNFTVTKVIADVKENILCSNLY